MIGGSLGGIQWLIRRSMTLCDELAADVVDRYD